MSELDGPRGLTTGREELIRLQHLLLPVTLPPRECTEGDRYDVIAAQERPSVGVR